MLSALALLHTLAGYEMCSNTAGPIDLPPVRNAPEAARLQVEFWNATGIAATAVAREVFELRAADDFGVVLLDGRRFQLSRVQFKFPSEHLINGQRFPLEVQILGRSVQGAVVVFATLVASRMSTVGSPLDDWGLRASLPELRDAHTLGLWLGVNGPLSAADLIPKKALLTRYEGSTTSAPCEPATWLVSTVPLGVSSVMLSSFSTIPFINVTEVPAVSYARLEIKKPILAPTSTSTSTAADVKKPYASQRVYDLLLNSAAPPPLAATTLFLAVERVLQRGQPCPDYVLQSALFASPGELPRNCLHPADAAQAGGGVSVQGTQNAVYLAERSLKRSFVLVCYVVNAACLPEPNYVPMIAETTPEMSETRIDRSQPLSALKLFGRDRLVVEVTLPSLPSLSEAQKLPESEDDLTDWSVRPDATKPSTESVSKEHKDEPGVLWPLLKTNLLPRDCTLAVNGVSELARFVDLPRPSSLSTDYRYTLLAVCPTFKTLPGGLALLLPVFVLTRYDFFYEYGEATPLPVPDKAGGSQLYVPAFAKKDAVQLIDVEALAHDNDDSLAAFALSAAELHAELKAEYLASAPKRYDQTLQLATEALKAAKRASPARMSRIIQTIFDQILEEESNEEDTVVDVVEGQITGVFAKWEDPGNTLNDLKLTRKISGEAPGSSSTDCAPFCEENSSSGALPEEF